MERKSSNDTVWDPWSQLYLIQIHLGFFLSLCIYLLTTYLSFFFSLTLSLSRTSSCWLFLLPLSIYLVTTYLSFGFVFSLELVWVAYFSLTTKSSEISVLWSFQWKKNHSPKVRNRNRNWKQTNEPPMAMTRCGWKPPIPRYQVGPWHLAQRLEPRAGWGIPTFPRGFRKWGGFHLDHGLRGSWVAMVRNKGWGDGEWQSDAPPTALQPPAENSQGCIGGRLLPNLALPEMPNPSTFVSNKVNHIRTCLSRNNDSALLNEKNYF